MKTYKLIILISALFLSSAFVARGEEVNIIAQADSAYSAEKYSEAVALYSKAIKSTAHLPICITILETHTIEMAI